MDGDTDLFDIVAGVLQYRISFCFDNKILPGRLFLLTTQNTNIIEDAIKFSIKFQTRFRIRLESTSLFCLFM